LWEEFLESIPEKIRNNTKKIFDYIRDEIKKENYEPLIALAKYDASLMKLEWRRDLDSGNIDDKEFINSLKIFFHYMYNSCFISKDYILDNSDKLGDINISIIQGRYDLVCPPVEAYKLDKKLNKSRLYFTM
jgi:proline iminopeptidase